MSANESRALEAARMQRQADIKAMPAKTALETSGCLHSEPSNARGAVVFVTGVMTSGFILELIGSMMAGTGMYKLGFLTGTWSSRSYVLIAVTGDIMSTTVVLIGMRHVGQLHCSDAAITVWMFLPHGLGRMPGMLANTCLVLLMIRQGWLRPLQHARESVGRTASSNYILTTLICQYLSR